MGIKENIFNIKKEIPPSVKIVAASKNRSAEEINQAIKGGINSIGENYVQEAEAKHRQLKGKVNIHLIGHLQTNKVKKAVEIFDMIETVDSEKLANEINKQCQNINKVMPVRIEVNIGEELNKSGTKPQETQALIEKIAPLKNIDLQGLMTMAPFFEKPEKARPYFKKIKQLIEKIRKENIPNVKMHTISMGMSNTYKTAIEEGATQVRIGTKLFGNRK